VGLEYLQRRRLHNLPGRPVPGLRHPQREEVLPHVQLELPLLQFVPVAPCLEEQQHCVLLEPDRRAEPVSKRSLKRSGFCSAASQCCVHLLCGQTEILPQACICQRGLCPPEELWESLKVFTKRWNGSGKSGLLLIGFIHSVW